MKKVDPSHPSDPTMAYDAGTPVEVQLDQTADWASSGRPTSESAFDPEATSDHGSTPHSRPVGTEATVNLTTPVDSDDKGDCTLPSARPQVVRSGKPQSQPSNSPRGESRFQAIRSHAKGGLGEVFLARDTELGRTVALKEIQSRHSQNRHTQDRFIAEAVITGALEHPGIVPIYGMGRYGDGRPYYAMRFITGTSFSIAIRDFHTAHPNRETRDYYSREFKSLLRTFIDLCRAIHYAHEHGILHRDIKPDNVMLGRFGETMVVDWGLAKVLKVERSGLLDGHENPSLQSIATETMGGAVMGTPAFMSPEQASGKNDELQTASDIYSLGATLFTVLSGGRPVEGRSSLEVIENVRVGKLRSLVVVAPKVPRSLASICNKALSINPNHRYASAGDLVEDIERWLADDQVLAHRDLERTGERLGRWVRRHHTWVVSGGMFLVSFAVVAVLAVILINQARNREVIAKVEAQAARTEAVERYRQSRAAIDTWLVGSNDALQFYPGTQSIRERMLELASQDYQRLADSSSRDPDLELERARALVRLGDIYQIQLRFADAQSRYADAAKVLEAMPAGDSIQHLRDAEAAHIVLRIGASRAQAGHWAEASEKFKQAVNTLTPLASRNPESVEIQLYEVAAYINLGEANIALGQFDEAIENLESAVSRTDAMLNPLTIHTHGSEVVPPTEPQDQPTVKPMVAKSERDALLSSVRGRELLGRAFESTGKYTQADQVLRGAVDRLTTRLASLDDDPEWVDALASTYVSHASVLRTAGMQTEMERSLVLAIEAYQKLVIAMPDVPRYSENLALTLTDLGIAKFDDERPREAQETLLEASERWQQLLRSYPDIAHYHEQNAVCEDSLSQVILELGLDAAESLAHASTAVRTYQELADLFPEVDDYQHRLAIARSHAAQAIIAAQAKEPAADDPAREQIPRDASLLFESAATGLRELIAARPEVSAYRYALGHVLYHHGESLSQANQTAAAKPYFVEAIQLWSELAATGHIEAAGDVATVLMTCPVKEVRDYAAAYRAAEQAVKSSARNRAYQTSIAVAKSLNQDVAGARRVMDELAANNNDLDLRDLLTLAIVSHFEDDPQRKVWIERGDQWLQQHPGNSQLNALRRLIAELCESDQ